jgi:hypothetical protein
LKKTKGRRGGEGEATKEIKQKINLKKKWRKKIERKRMKENWIGGKNGVNRRKDKINGKRGEIFLSFFFEPT